MKMTSLVYGGLVVAILSSSNAQARPITYELSGMASGQIGVTTFTNAAIHLIGRGDTTGVVSFTDPDDPSIHYSGNKLNTFSITIAGVGTATILQPSGIWVFPAPIPGFNPLPGVLFGRIDNPPSDLSSFTGIGFVINSALAGYNDATLVGPLTGKGNIAFNPSCGTPGNDPCIQTSLGFLKFDSNGPGSIDEVTTQTTFLATLDGDFNRDLTSDLLLQNRSTGQVGVWYMGGADGSSVTTARNIGGPVAGWSVVGTADLNADGHPDLIWQQDGTNTPGVWYMGGADGTVPMSAKNLANGAIPGWRIVGVGDLNRDGTPDLVWQQDGTNIPGVWFMGGADGSVPIAAKNLAGGAIPGWRVVAVADLDGDGYRDLIWQQDGTNMPGVWYLGGTDGTTVVRAANLASPPPGWRIVGAIDQDGNRRADLLWQQDGTGTPGIWYMGGTDGSAVLAAKTLFNGSIPDWRLVGPK